MLRTHECFRLELAEEWHQGKHYSRAGHARITPEPHGAADGCEEERQEGPCAVGHIGRRGFLLVGPLG